MKTPSDTEFKILAILQGGELSGRDIAKRYRDLTRRTISYGTLYTTIRRLKDTGWVSVRDAEDQVGNVRYVRILGAGVRAVEDARVEHGRLLAFGLPEGERS